MSVEDHDDPQDAAHDEPEAARRFTVADARAKAQQARAKAEFILSRAYGLLREPKKEWAQIRDEITTIPNILIGYVAPLAAIAPVATTGTGPSEPSSISGSSKRSPPATPIFVSSFCIIWSVAQCQITEAGQRLPRYGNGGAETRLALTNLRNNVPTGGSRFMNC